MNLQEKAKFYYNENGKNCAEAILLAASDVYNLNLNDEDAKLLVGFGGGMGCGSVCGCLAASIAVIGKIFYGNEKIYTVKGSFVSGATLVSEDDVIVLYKNKPWETLLIFLPFLYMGLGIFCGAIGGGLAGFFAALCACLNANYVRGEGKTSKKVLISLGLFVGLFIAWFVIYLMIVGVLATLIQAGQ